MGILPRSCQEFMRLCKVHLLDGCHSGAESWASALEREATRRLSLPGPCDALMPFVDGSEFVTSLNGLRANCFMAEVLTSSYPTLPISPLVRAASQQHLCNQQGEGEKQGSSGWCQEDLSALGLPTSPGSVQIIPLFLLNFLNEKLKHLVFILHF